MEHSRGSPSFDPRRRFARARFGRWFGRYFAAAFAVFVVGVVLGAGAIAMTDLASLQDVLGGMESPFPDELSFWFLVKNNLRVTAIIALGLVSFGVVSSAVLLFNGFIVGVVVGVAGTQGELLEAFAYIVPHGVLELGAFFLVGGLTFRVTHRFVNYLRRIDDTPITRQELFEVVVLLVVAAVAIVVAAWIEANLTGPVAEAFLDLV